MKTLYPDKHCICGHPENMHYGGAKGNRCMKIITRHYSGDVKCTCVEFRPDREAEVATRKRERQISEMIDDIRAIHTSGYPTRYRAFDQPGVVFVQDDQSKHELAVGYWPMTNSYYPDLVDGVYFEVVRYEGSKSKDNKGGVFLSCHFTEPIYGREQHNFTERFDKFQEALDRGIRWVAETRVDWIINGRERERETERKRLEKEETERKPRHAQTGAVVWADDDGNIYCSRQCWKDSGSLKLAKSMKWEGGQVECDICGKEIAS